MTRPLRFWASWSSLLLVAFAALTASAQEAPLTQGNRLIEEGNFEGALDVLLPEYARNPTAVVAHSVGRAYDALRDDPMAIRFYEASAQLRPGLDRETAGRVRERIKALKARLKDRPKKATLSVRGVVDGATVWLDGDQLGRTPLSGVLVKPGPHKVRVVHDHFEPWEKSITVEAYDSVSLEADLIDRPTDVLIHTEPAGAMARVQNGPECVTPCLLPLRQGSYVLTVERDGYLPLQHPITKAAGQILEVRLSLLGSATPTVAPPGQGLLHVLVTPPGSGIRVDRLPQGTAPLPRPVALAPGIHSVDVVMPGYRDYAAQVQIVAGQSTTISVQLQPGGAVAMPQPTPIWPTPVPNTWVTPTPVVAPQPDPGLTGSQDSYQSPLGWGLTGTGIALVAGGTVLAVVLPIVNKGKIDNATRYSVPDDPKTAVDDAQVYISGITRANALAFEEEANVGVLSGAIIAGIGGAVLIAGIVILVTDDGPATGPEFLPDGRRNFAPPSVTLSPWWTSDSAGAAATLTF